MVEKKTKKLTLNHVTKVEGHAEVDISIRDGKVVHAHVHSVEGARYFEGLIKGRKYDEVTLITSRICGICSCGHTIASIKAIEDAFRLSPTKQTRLLRELVTIGERIRSHASHIYFFSLPDYLGYESAIAMAKKFNQEIKDCLEIVSVGNELIATLAGRDMHPYVPIVGGMTKVPTSLELKAVEKKLVDIIPLIKKTIKLFASLKVPQYEKTDTVFLSLTNDKTFPLHTGDLVTNTGLTFKEDEYTNFIQEAFHHGSTAKFATINGKEYMTGALARINNSFNLLSPSTKKMIKDLKLKFPSDNLFDNNLAQALEMLHWCERAIEILEHNTFVPEDPVKPIFSGQEEYHGVGAIEVPRGVLFHDYTFNHEGYLLHANIITPTVQNLPNMEVNVLTYLNQVLAKHPDKDKSELKLEIEKMIRAFDPCFSCSTHFLKVNWL